MSCQGRRPNGPSPAGRRDHQQRHHGDGADGRPHEIPLQAFERRLAPCQQRADGGEDQQQQRHRNRDAVIERRAHRDLVALHQFGNLREPRAPQHGEAEQHKKEVVEQETRLARNQRLQFVLAAQVIFVLEEEENEDREGDRQEPCEPASDRRLREGVDGTDDAAAGEERSENRQPERGEDQPHVPDLQHAALFLHHDGMQEGGADEPRHERGVLDRVPSPVAAPSEHGVGPVRAEKNAAGEESPGDHGPAAGDVNPFFAGILHDQRAQREGEGDGESDVAEIEHGRMDDHLGILQKRIEAAAVGAQRAFQQAERVRGEVHQRQKENLHAGENDRRVGEEARIGLVAQAQDEAVSGEQQRPEEQRAFLAGPQRSELVRSGKIAVAVMKDVGDGEIVAEGGDDQRNGGEHDRIQTRRHRRGGRFRPARSQRASPGKKSANMPAKNE